MDQAAAPELGELCPSPGLKQGGYFFRVGDRSRAVLGLWELQMKSAFWPKGCLQAL